MPPPQQPLRLAAIIERPSAGWMELEAGFEGDVGEVGLVEGEGGT